MPQLFHPGANSVARASIIITVLLVIGGAVSAYALYHSDYVNGRSVVREQPVMFSHAHHVRGLGIDCRYCHTTVEIGASAGIPPTHTCMSCHSQVWTDADILEPVRHSYRTGQPLEWLRVHDLPDFVYFNHSIHVKKGVGCTTCHGAVDRMPLVRQEATLYMSWCLDCHREPERYLRPREETFSVDWQPPSDQLQQGARLVEEYDVRPSTSCSTCHR